MLINRYKAVFIFLLVALFLGYEMGIQVSPGVMTEELRRDLHLSALSLGIMSGFYFYTYTFMQIPAGLLFDRFNVRTVVVIPLIICAIGAYLFSLTHSVVGGSAARLLMGAGSAFAFISVLVVASDVFPEKYFGLLAGLAQMLAAFGAVSGELPLVPLIHHLGWRNAMALLAGVGLVLALLIWVFVRYRVNRIDDNQQSNTQSILSSLRRVCGNRQTWYVAIYACLLWAPMAGFASLWGVPYLVSNFHLTHEQAATVCSMMWFGIAAGSPLIGWWSDTIGNRRLPLTCAALVGLIAFSIVLLDHHLSTIVLGTLIFFTGAACSGQALSFALVKENNPKDTVAAAIGFNNMAVVIAGAIFQPLIGKLIQSHWNGLMINGIQEYSAGDYRLGLLLLPLCFGLGLVMVSFFIKERQQEATVSSQAA